MELTGAKEAAARAVYMFVCPEEPAPVENGPTALASEVIRTERHAANASAVAERPRKFRQAGDSNLTRAPEFGLAA